jgi:CRP/FNR family transcriptional regulator, cyclic AMP receptor protein
MQILRDLYLDNPVSNFFARGSIRRYTKSELILQAHEAPDAVYSIADGYVEAYSINNRGERYVHLILKKGEIFPLWWVFEVVPQNIYYQAVNDTTLHCLPRENLLSELQTNQTLAFQFLQTTLQQLKIYEDRIDNLEYKYASERLVYRLLFLAYRFGERSNGQITLKPLITQQMIASSVNLSRESVAREMEKLHRKGLIEYRDKHIVITDVKRLGSELKDVDHADWWSQL